MKMQPADVRYIQYNTKYRKAEHSKSAFLIEKGVQKLIEDTKIKVGIGFATGRRSFQKVLKTYAYSWFESEMPNKENVELNLLVAYDLEYSNTKIQDYTKISRDVRDIIHDTFFYGSKEIEKEIEFLTAENVITKKEAALLFARGYAGKRNSILYGALKNKLDYLLFLDDDEYPMAVTKTRATTVWGGQRVITEHLIHIPDADITNGHHCGYISPIPYLTFDDKLTENDFRQFIEAISNDIVNWDKIYALMKNGGVTYADTKILISEVSKEVEEVSHAKFISGANLCINLTKPQRVSPFYNPPGARGEDTFLSTCLSQRKVLRIPCYTFHDGFSTYSHLMDGVLPIQLMYIKADSEAVITRFFKACIGWIRYKPLLIYITQRDQYEEKIQQMRKNLNATLPQICAYFGRDDFMDVGRELERYHKNVKKHYQQYLETQQAWEKIMKYFSQDE